MSSNIIPVGKTIFLKATFLDAGGNRVEPVSIVNWSSSNAAVASTTPNYDWARKGFIVTFVTGLSVGTAIITASSVDLNNNPISVNYTVTVYAKGAASLATSQKP